MEDQKGELSHLVMIAEPTTKKKDTFPSKDSANEKPRTLGVLWPFQLPCPLYTNILLPLLGRLACGSSWLQTLDYNPLLIPNKTISAEDCLFQINTTK